jgi:hypothetical protein
MTRTPLEDAIRAFAGPANAPLRRMIRNSLASKIDPRSIARHVALLEIGKVKLQAVYEAWQAEQQAIERPTA